MMIRNQYSCGAGDALFGATFTFGQLRQRYSENGGDLTPRRRKFLRRFVPPFVSERPISLSTRFAIVVTKRQVLDIAPREVALALAPHFVRVEERDANGDDFWMRNPWLGDESFRVPDAAVDNELGSELDKRQRISWDKREDDANELARRRGKSEWSGPF